MKRRDFIRCLTVGSGASIVSTAFANKSNTDQINQYDQQPQKSNIYGAFTHGVASGDPLSDRVILWSRFVPDASLSLDIVNVQWEIATNKEFTKNYSTGEIKAEEASDFIVKVDVKKLKSNKKYYYRFSVGIIQSNIGETKTLPVRNVNKVRFAIATCANHPAGYFNVYREITRQHDKNAFDALLHIGDYIYEYGMDEYATDNAIKLDRLPSPSHECQTLKDYRRRYAQYRSDPDLLALHAKMPFIHIWDDHEIADNTWKDGALNHQPQEGDFIARRQAATQAFHEWLPIRNNMVEEGEIYRSFKFGDLVHLLMLDTRVTGRTQQLDYSHYSVKDPKLAYEQLKKDMYADDHHLLGSKQKKWIKNELIKTQTRWTAFGQQVLMTKIELPFNLLRALMGAKEAQRTRTPFDGKRIMNAARNPSPLKSPYNLDAWDGYPKDRDWLFSQMNKYNKSFVSFAGDTHNAWGGELTDKNNDACGIEFAAPSICSPGIESCLPLPPKWLNEIQNLFPELVEDLKYANIADRGFMAVTFNHDEVKCDWIFVDNILSQDYKLLPITTGKSSDCLELDIQDRKNVFEDLEDFLDDHDFDFDFD